MARWRRGTAALAAACLLATGCSSIITLELPAVDLGRPHALALQSVVLDPDGRQLAILRREHRQPATLSELPTHLVDAVLTAEDRRFFDHQGVDGRAVLRAALRNAAAGEVEQGASTITQQLIKNRYMPDADRTANTKLTEALAARELERTRTKASILTEYLNTVYFGEGAYGVKAAAAAYFRADVGDLDPAQSALLAALIRAPSALADDLGAAQLRRDDVLRRMTEYGSLSAEARDEALATEIEVHGRLPLPNTREPHLVDLVVRTLLADPSFAPTEAERADLLYGGGLTIHTTVRPDLQELARETLARHLPDPDDPEAAVTLVDPTTGHVLALTGNRSYEELQYDLATQARRQPGSTFKTFVLAAAIADGWHPEDRIDGRGGTIDTGYGTWKVRNYDRSDPPRVTLAGATRTSVNGAFARLGVEVGIPRVASLARAMGVESTVRADEPQITLGGGELGVTTWDLAAAYATLANGGTRQPITVIDRIEDGDGEVVWRPQSRPVPVLAPDVAYVTTQVLQGAVEAGTGLNARVRGWEVAGKTGTTSDHVDAWFVGTTPVLSAAVWVGRMEGRIPLRNVQGVRKVTGGSIPAEIFSDLMTAALADVEPVPFVLADEGWTTVEVDPRSGLLAAAWCPGERVRLPQILAPTETCPEPPPPPPAPAPPPPAPTPTTTEEPDDQPSPPPEPTQPAPTSTPTPQPPEPSPTPVEPTPPPASPAPPPDGEDGPGDG